MRIQYSITVPLLMQMIAVILLAVSHVSTCRNIHTSESIHQYSDFSSSAAFPVPAPRTTKSRIKHVQEDTFKYTASDHKTPGGPNPLHN